VIEAGYRKAYAHDAVVSHSHNFGVLERLQRSFDESYALRRLFNYEYGRGLRHAFRSFVGMTVRDLRFAKNIGLLRRSPGTLISMPIDNLMRVTGHYLGANGSRMPGFVRLRLSRDKRLMMGAR